MQIRPSTRTRCAALTVLTAAAAVAALPVAVGAQQCFVTIERFVPHTSTVPANAGERVGIYLREKATSAASARFASGESAAGRVVLFVHGGSVSSIPDYDLDYKDYSWMGYLAEAGFDTFAMDESGYGRSPRPMMDDPCNMSEADQALATPHAGPCEPTYPYGSTTAQSDWDEMDTVVDYIRELRGVDRVSLVGRRPPHRWVRGAAPRESRQAVSLRTGLWPERSLGGAGRSTAAGCADAA